MKKRIMAFQVSLFLVVAMALSAVGRVAFDSQFYRDLYTRLDLAASEDISEADLYNSIFLMTDYVQGKRDNLDGTVVWKGREQPTFNKKEITHMAEVRSLWHKARLVMIFSWLMAFLFGGLVLFGSGMRGWMMLANGFYGMSLFLLLAAVFFCFWMVTDFTGFWTWFHTIFFPSNLNWLLDPTTDFMIVICPEPMFSSMISQIAARFAAGLMIMGGFFGLIISQKEMYRLVGWLNGRKRRT